MEIIAFYTSKTFKTGSHRRYKRALEALSLRHNVTLFYKGDVSSNFNLKNGCKKKITWFGVAKTLSEKILTKKDVSFFGFGLEPCFYGCIWALLFKRRAISFIRGYELADARESQNLLSNLRLIKVVFYEYSIILLSKKIVYQTASHLDYILENYKLARSVLIRKAIVLPNDLPPSLPKESWGHEVCERKKNVVFVGSLIPRKNVDMLIQAFLECNELYDSLDIIGDGPLNNSLKKKYAEESKVNFIGQTKKAQCFIRQAYLVVVPSNRDPYPNVALEAISESTVIIGNNVPGVRDILLYNDLLFSDKKTLVEKLTMISNSLEYHSKLKDRVVKRKDDLSFDWDAEVSKIIENCS